MIRHVVLFKVKEEFKKELPTHLEAFAKMKGNVKELVDLELGEDFLHSPRSYDVVLIATFANKNDLEAYGNHPLHLPTKQRMAEISSSVVCVDYKF